MISSTMKHRIKAPFRLLGLDLVVRRPYPLQFLASYGIKTILDVGAHEGGFAEEVRMILPTAMLHSFEPVTETFERLQKRESTDHNFKAWNLAIGDRSGEATIEVNAMSASSSCLSQGTITSYCEASSVIDVQCVKMSTLDDWAKEVNLEDPILLKADVQGFEGHVLGGAPATLSRASVVILEVSFEEFYAGQPLFDSIYEKMRESGFCLKGLFNPWFDPKTSRQIQSNAIFDRRQPASIATR